MPEEITTRVERLSTAPREQRPKRSTPGETKELMRWASLLGGGLLALYGLRRSQRRLPLVLGGGVLAYRGVTGHFPGSDQLAVAAAKLSPQSGISIEKTVTINQPPRELYEFWRDVTHLPSVITHLKSVTPLTGTKSHWVAQAPLGGEIEWDAEITQEQEPTCLAWRSLPGAHVEHSGTVQFHPASNRQGTELKLQLTYRPPGGVIGKAVASLFNSITAQQVQNDLRRFKAIMEAGEIPTITGQSSGRQAKDEEQYDVIRSLGQKLAPGEVIKNWGFLTATVLSALWFLTKRQKIDFAGKSVVITGGSRGLGLELARCFAQEKAQLILLARDAEELDHARRELERWGTSIWVYPCDVRNQQELQQAVRYIQERVGHIDILVNNAGIIQSGPLEHMDLQDFENALATHFWGPLYLMQAVIPYMRRQGGGRIVNIASIGGKVAIPHLLPYCASKFALVGLSEGMRAELARDNIQVITVSPGLMRTGSHLNASFKGQHEKEFAWFSTASAMPFLSTTATQAARQIVDACRYGDASIIITPPARFLDLVHTVFPELTAGVFNLVNRLLPSPTDARGNVRKSGKESRSSSLSLVTSANDEAAIRNNEV